jgi:serine/threonine-protein kinase
MADAAAPRKAQASRPPALSAPTSAADQAVLDQLDRILRSDTFRPADRLKRFLTFIVRETLAGHSAEIKEFVIGVQVFRREEAFDPRTDPIVRVQARRLRAKLAHYHQDEGRADPITIELPKGSYVPTFKSRDTPVALKRTVSTALVSRNTVALFPFADRSEDRSLGAFCQGLRDEVLHSLSRLPGLRILADRGLEPNAFDMAARAGAGLVIEGSVRRADERLRISVHLIDGSSECYLWSESVDGLANDLFGAQEKVAEIVRRRLEPDLKSRRRSGGFGVPAENLAAQNLYLQGRYHLSQRTDEGLRKAVEFFERSLTEDGQFALAHSGLADAYGLLTHYGVAAPSEVWTKAASHAASAVLLDDQAAEGHTSLAHVRAAQDWDWRGAEREFQRALHLSPRYATAHHWYAASCLAPLGRLDEALDEITIARSLDPVSSIVARDLAVMHFYRRDFETALEHCDQTIELNPHFAPAYWMLGVIQEQLRDFDESAAAFQRAVHLSPQSPRMHGALGRTFALSGRREQALDVLEKLQAYARERYVSPVEFAWIVFALGEADEGFRWLSKACDDRSFDLIAAKVDPRFDPIRDDPRFKPVLEALNLGH